MILLILRSLSFTELGKFKHLHPKLDNIYLIFISTTTTVSIFSMPGSSCPVTEIVDPGRKKSFVLSLPELGKVVWDNRTNILS